MQARLLFALRRPAGLINALLSAFRATRNKLADENYANDVGQEAAAAGRCRGRDASDDEVNRWSGVVQGAERRLSRTRTAAAANMWLCTVRRFVECMTVKF